MAQGLIWGGVLVLVSGYFLIGRRQQERSPRQTFWQRLIVACSILTAVAASIDSVGETNRAAPLGALGVSLSILSATFAAVLFVGLWRMRHRKGRN